MAQHRRRDKNQDQQNQDQEEREGAQLPEDNSQARGTGLGARRPPCRPGRARRPEGSTRPRALSAPCCGSSGQRETETAPAHPCVLPSRQRTPAATLTEAPACRQCQQHPPGLQLTLNSRQLPAAWAPPGQHSPVHPFILPADAAVLTTRRPGAFPGGWRPLHPPGVRPRPAGLRGGAGAAALPLSLRLISTWVGRPRAGRTRGREKSSLKSHQALPHWPQGGARPALLCPQSCLLANRASAPGAGPGADTCLEKGQCCSVPLALEEPTKTGAAFPRQAWSGKQQHPLRSPTGRAREPQDHALGRTPGLHLAGSFAFWGPGEKAPSGFKLGQPAGQRRLGCVVLGE